LSAAFGNNAHSIGQPIVDYDTESEAGGDCSIGLIGLARAFFMSRTSLSCRQANRRRWPTAIITGRWLAASAN
jgi:hypothetical protein